MRGGSRYPCEVGYLTVRQTMVGEGGDDCGARVSVDVASSPCLGGCGDEIVLLVTGPVASGQQLVEGFF